MLGSILFNIFTNYLFYWVKESKQHIFADDNTVSSAEFSVEKLLKTLERESQTDIYWFKENNMIVNPDKFQEITVNKNSYMSNQYTLTSEKTVKLLGTNIDLSFNKHISSQSIKQAINLTR